MSKYYDRLIDKSFELALKTAGCVVVEGAKWCGKSTTAKRFAKTIVELQRPNTFKVYKLYSDNGDVALLQGEKPLMFDEWQKIPDLWEYIRAEIDDLGGKGHFILTGSAKPVENEGRHTGIGRMKKLVMRPMSLFESEESIGSVSLKSLFSGDIQIAGKEEKSLKDIAFIICRGGWPEAVTISDSSIALKIAKDYVSSLVETDIVEVDGIKRNASRARTIIRTYARNISAPAKLQTLQKDMQTNNETLDVRTIESYINALKKLFILEDIEAWSPRLRSKATLRTSDTRQFTCPSIAASVLDANPMDLVNDLNTFGLLFESLCIRDLRIYAESIEGKIYNYRDSRGLEADAIVHLDNGKWGLIEIKLGGEEAVEKAAKTLLAIKESIDLDVMKQPTFLMIITATGYAYRRSDGVLVVPLGCLKD
ncbi:MAG: DUF4143 domain-containing protein [Erysipelotrichales bacterium]|nr:DUF4143 domain-containing protein [Erysipelotrichales bacterium]